MTGPAAGITITDTVAPDTWTRLLDASPDATFFHRLDWITTYAKHHAATPLFLLAEADGRLVGGLPAVRFRRGPVHFYESLPMGTYGGPIVDPAFPACNATAEQLLRRFLDFGRHRLCMRLQCVVRRPSPLTSAAGFETSSNHIVPLTEGFEHFWMNIFPRNRRNECNRAEKRGVTVDIGYSDAYIDAYYPLHLEAHRRWGMAPHPRAFFEDIGRLDPDVVLLFTVLHGDEVLGAHLTFVSGDELVLWHGVTTRKDSKRLFPSAMVLKAEALEACRRGLAALNVGGSGGKGGVETFKRLVGGVEDTTALYERERRLLPLIRRLRRLAH